MDSNLRIKIEKVKAAHTHTMQRHSEIEEELNKLGPAIETVKQQIADAKINLESTIDLRLKLNDLQADLQDLLLAKEAIQPALQDARDALTWARRAEAADQAETLAKEEHQVAVNLLNCLYAFADALIDYRHLNRKLDAKIGEAGPMRPQIPPRLSGIGDETWTYISNILNRVEVANMHFSSGKNRISDFIPGYRSFGTLRLEYEGRIERPVKKAIKTEAQVKSAANPVKK